MPSVACAGEYGRIVEPVDGGPRVEVFCMRVVQFAARIIRERGAGPSSLHTRLTNGGRTGVCGTVLVDDGRQRGEER